MPLRITTWNVNGIRNPFGYQPWRDSRTFSAMFDILEADIVIMQEVKIQRKDLKDDMVLLPGWDCYFSLPKHKKGYSGVAIYTRQASCGPIRAEEGILGVLSPPGKSTPYRDLPDDERIGGYPSLAQLADLGVAATSLDAEGRCVVLEFPAFVLFGVYSPANSSGTRDDYRFAFLSALDIRMRNLHKLGKRLILAGDLNVSRDELDTAGAEDDKRKLGITHEDYISTPNRRIFNQLLEGGEVIGPRDEDREHPILWDILRGFHPGRQRMFTHWEQKINARPGNYGSRIDHILSSIEMKDWFERADIQEGLMGSDHCPVYAVMKDQVDIDGTLVHLSEIVNPPGVFKAQQRLRSLELNDHPALSAKLMPEFDKRRSIKDMFSRKPITPTQDPASQKSNAPDKAGESTQSTEPISNANVPGKRVRTPLADPPKSKRVKLSATTETGRGQATLNSFFSRTPSTTNMSESDQSPINSELAAKAERDTDTPTEELPLESKPTAQTSICPPNDQESEGSSNAAASDQSDAIVDPVVSADKWRTLFSKPPPPRCEHNEPCTKLQTKVKGANNGRHFWICARPIGPSGSKERNTQWRCRTFIWASDWNGNT